MKSFHTKHISSHMSKLRKTSTQKEVAKTSSGPIVNDKNGNVIMQILAKPGAKTNGFINIEEEGVNVQINARPVDGEANTELLKYISSVFGLKKNEISFNKGMKSRHKILLLSKKDLTAEKVIEKIKDEIKQKV